MFTAYPPKQTISWRSHLEVEVLAEQARALIDLVLQVTLNHMQVFLSIFELVRKLVGRLRQAPQV